MAFNADLLYQKYAGQTLSYDGIPANAGQCVQWVEYVLTDGQYGYGLQPFFGNAIDWFNGFAGVLAKNFDRLQDGTIKKGDIVIFNQNVGSVYGHIDMAMSDGNYNQFTGADSNWAGNKTVHLVNHVGSQYILGVLRLKGSDMSDIADLDFVRTVCVGFTDLQPESNQNFMNNVGLSKSDVVNNFLNYKEARNLRLDAEAYRKGGTGTPKVTVNGQEYIPK